MSSKKFGHKLVSYAQNTEDIKLFGYFWNMEQPGFYVDIGANHATHDSVTKFFYVRGWSGINIEPQKHLIKLLKAERPRDKNICTGISDKPGKLRFRQYESNGLSTFSTNLHASYETGYEQVAVRYEESELKLVTLQSILRKYAANKAINFLKVDVEGFEYNVIKSNDWKMFRPWVICVESTGADKRWQAILEKAGYIRHIYDGLNDYYVASEHENLIQNYRAFVASEVIRYDVANLPNMKFTQGLRDLKHGIAARKRKAKHAE